MFSFYISSFKIWFVIAVTQCGKCVSINSNVDVVMSLIGCHFHSNVNTGSRLSHLQALHQQMWDGMFKTPRNREKQRK